MSKKPGNPKGLQRVFRFRTLWKIAVAIAVVAGIVFFFSGEEMEVSGGTTFKVARGNLPITVVEGGSAESNNPHHVKCEVERRQVKILSIIEEGYRITKEDIENKKVLVELDSGELEDRVMEQEIQYQSAKASLSKAQQDYEIQEEENKSDIQAATREAKFKGMELKKYLGEELANGLMKKLLLRRNVEETGRQARSALQIVEQARDDEKEAAQALKRAEKELADLQVPHEVLPEDDAREEAMKSEVPEAGKKPGDSKGGPRRGGGTPGDAARRQAAREAAAEAGDRMEARDKAEKAVKDAKKAAEAAAKSLGKAEAELKAKEEAFDAALKAAEGQVAKPGDEAKSNGLPYTVEFVALDFAGASSHPNLGGEAAQKRDTLSSDIMLENEELITASETLEGTQKLYKNDFVTETELKRDQMAVERRKIGLQSKTTSKELFFRYEFPKTAEETFSAYEEALRKLDRVKKEAVTKLVNAQVALDSALARFKVQEKARADNLEQIEKCKIYAEHEGLVVYGDGRGRWWNDPIREGTMVHEQMTILTIPDINDMAIKVQVHESAIKRIKKGLKAEITVEAFPDEKLTGEVTKVSVLPSSENRWMNPDLKLYETTVSINGRHEWLKPGMTAEVTIHIDELEDVLYVPLQAVGHRGDARVCYLANGEERVVQTGQFNDKFIQILGSDEGLKEGDVVLLKPKDRRKAAGEEEGGEKAEKEEGKEGKPRPREGGGGGGRP